MPRFVDISGTAPIDAADTVRAAIGWALTAEELSAGLSASDINSEYKPGHIYRYVTNTTPGTTDVTTDFQNFLDLGGVYDLDARVDDIFRVTAQLTVKSATKLHMGQDCVILRDWAGTVGAKWVNACFANENAPDGVTLVVDPGPWTPSTTDDDIYIEGGRIRPTGPTKTGVAFYMMGTVNLTLRDVVVERTYQDWAFAIGGENFSLTGIRVEENAEVYEDGIHIYYGSGLIKADYIHAGDDCFAVGSNYNLPVDGIDIQMGRFYSEKGHAFVLNQERGGSTAGFATSDQTIRNIRFHSGSGRAGMSRNGLALAKADVAGLLRDITVDNVSLDAGTQSHDGNTPVGLLLQKIDWLQLNNVTVRNARRHPFHLVDCSWVEMHGCIAHDSQGSSAFRALEIEDCLDVKITGGEYRRTLTHCIRISGNSSVSITGTLLRGIADNFAGIAVLDTSTLTAVNCTFRKASGQTSSQGIRNVSSSTKVIAQNCLFDVDSPYSSSATPSFLQIGNIEPQTEQIVSGSVNTFGADLLKLLVRNGNTTDNLTTLNNGYVGQIVTLVNGEANPVTNYINISVSAASNGFTTGINHRLDGADDFITVRFNGTSWDEIARSGYTRGVKVATPASAAASGEIGQWAATGSYVYFCVADDTWVRAAVASW